jgi:hypothetical protein
VIAGSIPAVGMDVLCFVSVVCRQVEFSVCRADHSSRGVLTSELCVRE